jgi:hypothetical protein
LNGCGYNTNRHGELWLGNTVNTKGITYRYPGVVTRLIEDGKISSYLSPDHARHTYITITAWDKENSSALVLLAACCENSVEVILKHYLDVDRSVRLVQN